LNELIHSGEILQIESMKSVEFPTYHTPSHCFSRWHFHLRYG